MLDVARCILGSEVYIYQFKVNSKAAFSGDVWAWHQDFIFWLREDGVPAPLLTTAILFLEEVNEFNGPLMLIPGSHAGGVIDVPARPDAVQEGRDWVANLTADINYALPMNVVSSLVERFGIIAPKGPAGSVLFFHPNVVHGSTLNISPFSRALALVTYCDIANRPAEMDTPRPEFLCARDFTVVSGDEV
jgi:ectoine hydroxylase